MFLCCVVLCWCLCNVVLLAVVHQNTHLHPRFKCSVRLHGSGTSWLLNTTTKRDKRFGARQRERILRGGSTASVRTVVLTSEQAVKGGQGDCVDRVRRVRNLERRRHVTGRFQEDETERTTHWLWASNFDRVRGLPWWSDKWWRAWRRSTLVCPRMEEQARHS